MSTSLTASKMIDFFIVGGTKRKISNVLHRYERIQIFRTLSFGSTIKEWRLVLCGKTE